MERKTKQYTLIKERKVFSNMNILCTLTLMKFLDVLKNIEIYYMVYNIDIVSIYIQCI